MENDKVFGSDITRTRITLSNNLYDLLIVKPVTPLQINSTKHLPCDFVPKTDKYFIPKRKPRPKVRTVRDIRNAFEKDVYGNLSVDLEKQQNILLRKIRGGSSSDEKTKIFAGNMLKSEKPLSKTTWQMIININPDNCPYSSQYVLWNGKCIQVNGSRGGKTKFIYKYDLSERRASLFQKFKRNSLVTKKHLLKNSLSVKFKPGPLSRKKQLDDSFQKYNIGNIELVHLPKPGLEILPEYGKPVETSIANFLHNLRDVNGIISDKWAEFAVSTLGTIDNGQAVQLNRDNYVTFDLRYKYYQHRLIMRHDIDRFHIRDLEQQEPTNIFKEEEEITHQVIQRMLDEILISVDINLLENNIYTEEDSGREPDKGDINNGDDNQPKDKIKRKGQLELHRLDVTVIRLCNNQEKKEINTCRKSFCTLGCICDSLDSSHRFKNHCGLVECMFECKCDFNQFCLNGFDDNIIPDLVTLDTENNLKLSKEEQKFHQTVILSGEKSILLKSQKRNWKAPEKYADFYSNMCLKTKKDIKRILSVEEVKLNCENIEPWCMIHNLYKCFCKGKFTENLCSNTTNDEVKSIDNEQCNTNLCNNENFEPNLNDINNESNTKSILRPRIRHQDNTEIETTKSSTENTRISFFDSYQCARVQAYKKRKYRDSFYFNTNKKITELEKNDQGLHKRMMEILKNSEDKDAKKPRNDLTEHSTIELSSSPEPDENIERNEIKDDWQEELASNSTSHKISRDVLTTQFTSPAEHHLNNKLKAWLEPSLKMYRQRFAKGFFKKSLEPPKPGKIALYPWDFIIERYHEKKNLFLVTIQKPFRIFMAVDHRNALFGNCIDIRSIKDLKKYPISVKNIVTKDVDRLTDQLCILRGLNSCWELVGSVKKVRDVKNSDSENNFNELHVEERSQQNWARCANSPRISDNDSSSNWEVPLENATEQSKWFVMTVENDFSEIQFYSRGFFVKYDSIIKAINVARVSEKTVRLSSQKCSEGNSDPQFGIYAIPSANKYCVFIGPYEKDEALGIETVKTTIRNQKFKTRGVWITTNKVDNLRVIDNPLSFMSQVNLEHEQILDDTAQGETITGSVFNNDFYESSKVKSRENNKVVKLVKPIKITKTNNFYHLTPSGYLKPISVSPEKSKTPVTINKQLSLDSEKCTSSTSLIRKSLISELNDNDKVCIEEKQKSLKRPIAEIAPHIKEIQENRESPQKPPQRKSEGGMFILKPEEINSRSLANKICLTLPPVKDTLSITGENEIHMDIENFLANSVECSAPNNDVLVISDDEDYCNTKVSNTVLWKNVWIICNSVKNIGWISGRQDDNGHLSFEFPGFKYTEFYAEQEAFEKITQVLARKVYIPDNVSLSWSVVKSKKELHKLKKLRKQDLNPDYVLTKNGLIHKFKIAEHINKNVRTYSRKRPARKCLSKFSRIAKREDTVQLNFMNSEIEALDMKSNTLLEEGEQLLSETLLKRDEISVNISEMSNDRRQTISDRLRSILSSSHYS